MVLLLQLILYDLLVLSAKHPLLPDLYVRLHCILKILNVFLYLEFFSLFLNSNKLNILQRYQISLMAVIWRKYSINPVK